MAGRGLKRGFRTSFVFLVALASIAIARPSYSPALPSVGDRSLTLLSPDTLELSAITAGNPTPPADKAPTPTFPPPPLKPSDFTVTVAGETRKVLAIGFRRRPVYAPLAQRDLRIGNYVYFRLADPVKDGDAVEITYEGGDKIPWLATTRVATKADPLRHGAAIHVNHVGYLPGAAKVAFVGYYLGTLGELSVAGSSSGGAKEAAGAAPEFQLVDAQTGKIAHRGRLTPRPDRGMPHPWYRKVWEASFTEFKEPGEYRLAVPGFGASYPFFIDDGIAAAFARNYALGIYHQRCGAENALPYSRFVHEACHTAPAEIPAGQVPMLVGWNEIGPGADLFPFVRKGKVDVSGGHHDAGDYSKYTINSAGFIHHLLVAVDVFEGVAALDNLGLPESGDGKGDLLQIAKWEADFLVKMQDEDGGFYFLVYPRNRRYEGDVLPDRGDPQIVWPKNSAVTAAAVGALAQCATSPQFKQHYPDDAKRYLEAARKGWKFLREARAARDGDIYRKFTHYGDGFKDDDELLWAAVEMFLATGDAEAEKMTHARLDPRNPATRRWGWKRMTEGYGRAIRSYAFAARTGRIDARKLDARLVIQCENEIVACADDWAAASRDSAYGTSYPEPTKRVMGGGWYFPLDHAFDMAVACQLDFPPKADRRAVYRNAIIANLNYEAGANPVDVCFVTGLGWKRPLDIVHQYAQNDRRALPVSGIPLGAIQEGFHYMDNYRGELGALCYPLDGAKAAPYPILDRWGDSFNLQTEFVIVNQARALAVAAWLLAATPLRDQAWKPVLGKIEGAPATATVGKPVTLRFAAPGKLDPDRARIVWDARDHAPAYGREFTFTPRQAGAQWVEIEAQWPDGRRVLAVVEFPASGGTELRSAAAGK